MRSGGPHSKHPHFHRSTAALIIAASLFAASCGKNGEDPGTPAPTTGPVAEDRVRPEDEKSLVYLRGNPITRDGTRVRSVQTLEMTDGIVTTSTSGVTSQGKAVMKDEEIRTIEFVSDKEKLVELERKKTMIEMAPSDGEPVKTEAASPLQGTQLSALRQADGSWWFGLKEGTATPEQTAELQKMGDPEVLTMALYPEKPVSLGDKWESDVTAVRGLLGGDFQPEGGSVKMEIVRLKSHEGQRCAEIDLKITCDGTYSGGQSPLAMNLDLSGKILRSLNTFQDLQTSLSGILALEQKIAAPGASETRIKIEGAVQFLRENTVSQPSAPSGSS